jgi:bacillithiol synthase
MQVQKIPFAETQSFSKSFLDYIGKSEPLKKFYGRFPETNNFGDQIKEKATSFPKKNREVLVTVLQNQYKNYTLSEAVKKNMKKHLR